MAAFACIMPSNATRARKSCRIIDAERVRLPADRQHRSDPGKSRSQGKKQYPSRNDAPLRDTVSLEYDALLIAAAEYDNDWATEKALNPVSPNIIHRGTVPPLLPTKPAFVQFLLADPRTDLDQCDQFGKTAPIYAVCNNWVSVMRDLVAKKSAQQRPRRQQSSNCHCLHR